MLSDEDQLKELQLEAERLQRDVELYRSAMEECLQQLNWCIGYFAGSNKSRLARAIGANVGYIRRNLLHRDGPTVPASDEGSPADA